MKVRSLLPYAIVACCISIGHVTYAAKPRAPKFDFLQTVEEFRQARDEKDFRSARKLINALDENYKKSYANLTKSEQEEIRTQMKVDSVSAWIKKNKKEVLTKLITEKEGEGKQEEETEEEQQERKRLIAKIQRKQRGKKEKLSIGDEQVEQDIKEATEALAQINLGTLSKDELEDMADKFKRIQGSYPEGQELTPKQTQAVSKVRQAKAEARRAAGITRGAGGYVLGPTTVVRD